jgi:hypothetical protein
MTGNFSPEQFRSDQTGQNFRNENNAVNGGNMTRGEIISMDETSITIKTESNGSKIIMFSDNTEITETISVPKENMSTGKTVMITGETNEDGTISADTIFIRRTK